MGLNPSHLSREQQVAEIIRCGKDPVYFMRNYAKIQHAERGTIPFETYPFQDDCVKAFEESRLNIVLKSRQLGLSTICAGYAAWMALFHKDKNILVIATKLPVAMNFIKKVRHILQSVPAWLMITRFEPTKQSISFSNGSSVTAIPTSEDAGRSEALSLLIVDEAAWIRDFDSIWTGLSPTISTGGRAILLSTPNGVGGQFYKLWTEAEAGANGFNPIKLPWNVHPEHDEEWFKKETRNLSTRELGQEYLCDFTTSGDTFLQPEDLTWIRSQVMNPIEKCGEKNNLWVWAHPVDGKSYLISADVSRGDARDYSAFHVIDVDECEVVAEYMGKIPPEKLAVLLDEWGRKYNNALLMIEQNTFGYFANVQLRDSGYPKLYYHSVQGDPFNYIASDPKMLPGFPTTAKTRPQMLTKLSEMIREKKLKVYSDRLQSQLQSFVWHGSRAEASKDSYDDLIMGLAIGCWLIEGNAGLSQHSIDMAYAMLKATSLSRTTTEQHARLSTINEARPLVNPNIMGINAQSLYRPKHADAVSPNDPVTKTKDFKDFNWLLK